MGIDAWLTWINTSVLSERHHAKDNVIKLRQIMDSDEEVVDTTWNLIDMHDNNHETASVDGEQCMISCGKCFRACLHIHMCMLPLFSTQSHNQSESPNSVGPPSGDAVTDLLEAATSGSS